MNASMGTFKGKQLFFGVIGWLGAVIYGSICIGLLASGGFGVSNWPAYVFLAFAVLSAMHAIRNAGLAYVVGSDGIARKTRWREQELVRWSDVSELSYSRWNSVLSLKLKNARKCKISCVEVHDSAAFEQLVREHVGR